MMKDRIDNEINYPDILALLCTFIECLFCLICNKMNDKILELYSET